MTNRRDFLKNTVLSSTGLIVLPLISFDDKKKVESKDYEELKRGFINPPNTARPMAYWMWMNGHITKEGISLDLQAMKDMGLAGAFIYNTGTGVVRGPVDYGSKQWKGMMVHAMQEAQKLGLELSIHNSPGYSSTGGSWVTPDISMQELVWSEVMIKNNGSVDIELPLPPKKLNYYKDAFVIAFPSLPAEKKGMFDGLAHVFINGQEVNKAILFDNNSETVLKLEAKANNSGMLLLQFSDPFEARAITITRVRENTDFVYDDVYDHPPSFVLEYSNDGKKFETITTINMPLVRYISVPATKSFAVVKAKYYRITTAQTTWLTSINLHGAPRLADWQGKANFSYAERTIQEQVVDAEFAIDPATIINLSDKLGADGHLKWQAPVGDWTILRFGHTSTGTKTVSAPDNANGLEIDKFSKEAVARYFNDYLDQLIAELKPFTSHTFKAVIIDSYEVGQQNWTANLPIEFKQRRGYDIISWLPTLTGRIVHNIKNTEKFLWDFRKTHADLMADNYYGEFKRRCHEQSLQFYAQAYGDGVFDSLQVGEHLDMPMAEFWTRYVPGTLNACKGAVTIAHGYGKKIVAAEAFTGTPSTSRWTEYPYALKSQGDHLFFQGINRFILHVFVHQPYLTGYPGMSMGPYGSHFDRSLTWLKQSSGWISYLTRAQYLLQQGNYVADVCYFKGEEPTTVIPDINYVDPPTPKNLAGDVIGPDVLLKRMTIRNNRIVLPDGMTYSLLILGTRSTSLQIISKLKQLVYEGLLLVVTSKSESAPGLADKQTSDAIRKLVNELWGDLDGISVKERSFGKGRIFWNTPLHEIFKRHTIRSDFEFSSKNGDAGIHYVHRKWNDTDIYFISNHFRRREQIVASFRISDKIPEFWNPETGETFEAVVFDSAKGRTNVWIELEPSGSQFIIFKKEASSSTFKSISRNGVALTRLVHHPTTPNRYQNLTNNFTIALWVKPDTYAPLGKGILIFPPEAEIVYGKEHVACGLAAGQNGVHIFERGKGANRDSREVIKANIALQGWTHIAVRYKTGRPSLYINGVLIEEKGASGKIVHPGLHTAPTDELFSAAFEGSYAEPQLFQKALNANEIRNLFNNGLPDPLFLPAVSIQKANKLVSASFWKNGRYEFRKDAASKKVDIDQCKIQTLDSGWTLRFPKGSGAPPSIKLSQLISLHKHEDFSVRHFAGTTTYATSFQIDNGSINNERQILLHLGRVEVIAEVKLNNVFIGNIWKEPYQIDITKAIQPGTNNLEIAVTNLWPNRMIGDEYLPRENDYDQNGLITQLPEWYINNKPKNGQRVSFAVWNNFKKTDPLLESGLLGPVRIIFGVKKIIE